MYVSKVRWVMDRRMSTSSMQFCWKRCSRFSRVQEELQSSGARDGTSGVCAGKAAKTAALCFSQTFVSFQGAQGSTCFLKKNVSVPRALRRGDYFKMLKETHESSMLIGVSVLRFNICASHQKRRSNNIHIKFHCLKF